MNPDVRATWVAALRSDRFRQGTGRLTRLDEDGRAAHCCLGVLCELAVEAGVPVEVSERRWRDDEPRERDYDGQDNYPPSSVLDWAGLDERNPRVVYQGSPLSLSDLNDSVELSFRGIADLVEEQL